MLNSMVGQNGGPPMGHGQAEWYSEAHFFVLKRGLKLTPLLLMTSFKQWLIREQRREQMDPDWTPTRVGSH